MHACTIAARNYLAQVQVLASSFLQHHPGGTMSVLVTDAESRDEIATGPYRAMSVLDIGLDVSTVHEMATIYDVTELATALKPTFLRHLIDETAEPVTYLDPDIAFYVPIPEADALARERGILLTPHILRPLPRDGLELTEQVLLGSGMYNLGFIAVDPAAAEFLRWWEERTRFGACAEPALSMFTDQRWIDFVPPLFDAAICRDPGWNVAYWNLHERPLGLADDDTLLAGGAPLRFFHFSGFDPEVPHLLSKHQGSSPRTLLSESPLLTSLAADYSDRLAAAGWRRCSATPYRYGSISSGPLPREVRRLVREALLHPAPGDAPPPDPFGPDGDEAFVEWLNTAVVRVGGVTVTRLAQTVWASRPDLRHAFPQPTGPDASGLMHWMDCHAVVNQTPYGHLHRPRVAGRERHARRGDPHLG